MKRVLVRLAGSAALLMFSAVPACGDSCADIGCVPNVTVYLAEPISVPGSYTVKFVADGHESSCTIDVPSQNPGHCTADQAFVHQDAKKGITYLSLDGKLKALSIVISNSDGARVVEQSYAVKYDDQSIGGVGCGTCPAAVETLSGESRDAGVVPPDAAALD